MCLDVVVRLGWCLRQCSNNLTELGLRWLHSFQGCVSSPSPLVILLSLHLLISAHPSNLILFLVPYSSPNLHCPYDSLISIEQLYLNLYPRGSDRNVNVNQCRLNNKYKNIYTSFYLVFFDMAR